MKLKKKILTLEVNILILIIFQYIIMEFNFIVNPESGRRVSIYGKTGKKVLRKYLQTGGAMRSGSRIPSDQYCQGGGAIRGSSRIPSDQYCQKGGNNCKKYKKTKEPKCQEQVGCKWVVRQGCHENEVDVPLAPEPKRVTKTPPSKPKSSKKPCKSYKKTKDPKCEEQEGCYWIKGKGCNERVMNVEERYVERKKVSKPSRVSSDIKNSGKKVKTTTTKKHGKSKRLSAGTYYRTYGNDITLGDKCNIRQSTPPEYKCMTKTKSGVARWGKCPNKTQICKEDEYM